MLSLLVSIFAIVVLRGQDVGSVLKQHVYNLASDFYMGRACGTVGGVQAAYYIARELKKAGAEPVTSSGYHQRFPVVLRRNPAPGSYVKGISDWVAWRYSGSGEGVAGVCWVACDGGKASFHRCKEGRAIVIRSDCVDGGIFTVVHMALSRKPAIIVVEMPELSYRDTSQWYVFQDFSVPVVLVGSFGEKRRIKKLRYRIFFDMDSAYGFNVMGMYPCNVEECSGRIVIVGAHFDHLGRGEVPGIRGEPGYIYNGADDNASGVSLLLTLARYLDTTKRRHSYLVVAFDGEELGLLGSSYFIKHPPVDTRRIMAYINFDMVGRMDSVLIINGVASSDKWVELLNDAASASGMRIKLDRGGSLGRSDHSSFIKARIPAIHLFTGAHTDYHKPTDDAERINYEGIEHIYHFVTELIKRLENVDTLGFNDSVLISGAGRVHLLSG